ncbi:hypothetical protein L210DRAFT_1028656, partial [Boletus edulis BED1]
TDELTKGFSLTRKVFLLLMLCSAQFLDAFNNAALVPTLMGSTGITGSQRRLCEQQNCDPCIQSAYGHWLVRVLSPLTCVTASALTIPSAFAHLVRVFPGPLEQARGIAVLGGCGAVADGGCWHYS